MHVCAFLCVSVCVCMCMRVPVCVCAQVDDLKYVFHSHHRGTSWYKMSDSSREQGQEMKGPYLRTFDLDLGLPYRPVNETGQTSPQTRAHSGSIRLQ